MIFPCTKTADAGFNKGVNSWHRVIEQNVAVFRVILLSLLALAFASVLLRNRGRG